MLVETLIEGRSFVPATAEVAESPSAPLAQLAADALMAADGDSSEAARHLLRALLLGHAEYYAYRSELAMLAWAKEQVRHAGSGLRGRIEFSAPQKTGALAPETASLMAAAYLNWPLNGRTTLRNATKADIDQAVQKYQHDASVYSRRAKWLQAVAKQLPDNETKVGDVLSEEAIAKIAARFKV